MSKFLLGRVNLVRQLIESELPWHYADCALILCTVLSACSSRRWPGKGIDRRRFIELLIRHSPADAHADWVSVPALIAVGLLRDEDTPYGPGGTRIYTDEEIDLPLDKAVIQYPQVDGHALKRHTYAALIYEWLRCAYAHEYAGHENTTAFQPSSRDARTSYIGRGLHGGGLTRIVSFHLPYLIDLTEHHAGDAEAAALTPPAKWWIDQCL